MFSRTLRSLPAARIIRTSSSYRSIHATTGFLMSLDSRGNPVSEKVRVMQGDTCVIFPPEIGFALQAGLVRDKDLENQPITYFHEAKTFAHSMQIL